MTVIATVPAVIGIGTVATVTGSAGSDSGKTTVANTTHHNYSTVEGDGYNDNLTSNKSESDMGANE